jgi:hypothetical protein
LGRVLRHSPAAWTAARVINHGLALDRLQGHAWYGQMQQGPRSFENVMANVRLPSFMQTMDRQTGQQEHAATMRLATALTVLGETPGAVREMQTFLASKDGVYYDHEATGGRDTWRIPDSEDRTAAVRDTVVKEAPGAISAMLGGPTDPFEAMLFVETANPVAVSDAANLLVSEAANARLMGAQAGVDRNDMHWGLGETTANRHFDAFVRGDGMGMQPLEIGMQEMDDTGGPRL